MILKARSFALITNDAALPNLVTLVLPNSCLLVAPDRPDDISEARTGRPSRGRHRLLNDQRERNKGVEGGGIPRPLNPS